MTGQPAISGPEQPAGTQVPALAVGPRSGQVDETLSIVVSGLRAGQRVTVRAATRDGALVDWHSTADFVAAPDGTVDVGRDAPAAGYPGVDPLGLLWAMRPTDPGRQVFFTKRRPTALKVTVSARAGGESIGEVGIERCFGGEHVLGRPTGDDLVGTLYHDDERRPAPAVLLLAGSDGGQLDHAAALLAGRGYAALALSYFGAEDLPPTLSHIDLGYFRRAVDWLLDQPEVDRSRPASVIGLSRGGELALQLAALDARLHNVVAAAPSSLRQAGLTSNYTDYGQPAWELDGRALPFLKGRYNFGTFLSFARTWLLARPMRQRRAFERAMRDADAVAAARIEVEAITGPVLLISGADDRLWPSDVYAGQVERRLLAHGHPAEVVNLTYPGAGHFVSFPYALPGMPPMVSISPMSRLRIDFGGSAPANAAAAVDSWRRVLEFLGRHTSRS
ncbi:acyl-CoA thioesterase/bile acid-CoA:amino acid N-acyltransferase family protein [Catellatospora coxensis]|uniref:Acyl-CoA thioesterase n=1 Tax=Catellatospora coxensis TaxID=310354 RepID=A0A8J3KXZ2_9ACTN|nr:acyl-CoA thioesterase/bile acid-CoA:amino acid N-acyltransferase family protein [Catellatospora coxensis]GIG05106.1 acyl-CoA thioesterase [Catellatospora coxensis]